MQKNSPLIKLKFVLLKIHCESRRRKGEDVEFNSLLTVTD